MRVAVYKNLNRGCWSVARVSSTGGTIGKLLQHVDSVALSNVVFVVKEKQRATVVREHCRQVHAWCIGDICDSVKPPAARQVTYNPYRSPSFHTLDGKRVDAAPCVWFHVDGRAYL